MRNDQAPFTDPRVRQAVAYTLDRPGMVAGLLSGDGQRRQRLSVRAAVPVHRHDASRSARRTSPRPSSCWRRPGTRTASRVKLDHRAVPGDPAAGAR